MFPTGLLRGKLLLKMEETHVLIAFTH
jgi:hypothetical protein